MARRYHFAVLTTLALGLTLALTAHHGFGRNVPQASKEKSKSDTSKSSQARLARGRYLVEGPMHCFDCHSDKDWKASGAPVVPGKKGGGAPFPMDVGFPLNVPNISPDPETGAGKWTDEQLARAIREGIGHDGRRLFPLMPYMNFRVLSDEDLVSVIKYIRSIPPVHNAVRATPLPEPVKNSLPPPAPITGPVPPPDFSNPIKRGAYLVTLGNCVACHTPVDQQGRPLPGLDFAGGRIMKGPWGIVASANITSDASGISYYTPALFLQALRTGHVRTRKLNSIMPWGNFRNMTDEDLKAIYAYLRTLPPIVHRVDNTEPPALCKKCGNQHGYGDRN